MTGIGRDKVNGRNLYCFRHISPEINDSVFVAPTAAIIGDVAIARKASVWFGCVLRGDEDKIRVGEKTNIQDLTVCHTDKGLPLTIGTGVTIGHRCVLHGCTIQDDCLIGMGAIIMNGVVVGRGSVVAAGTTILENTIVPPYSLIAGIPGEIKRTLSESEVLPEIEKLANGYQELAARYMAESE